MDTNTHQKLNNMNVHPICYFDMTEQELQHLLQLAQETVD
jgi:hypothetical protein